MKVIITNDSLDSLLSVQISKNGGQSYSTYSVSSLKNGLTFDCSPKDLKVICDVNTLKYIQVLADGEKASNSDIDLSNYIKIRDIYVDVYENPYYGKKLTEEEINKLTGLDSVLYEYHEEPYYYKSVDFNVESWDYSLRLNDSTELHYVFQQNQYYDGYYYYFNTNLSEGTYFIVVPDDQSYINNNAFYTNARVHFIKHF